MIINRCCFDGYLTDHCKDCKDWADGSNGGVGCASRYPISSCPYFSDKIQDARSGELAACQDIYYAHHQWKYGTKIEAYELDLIRSHFPGKSILNPSTDIYQNRTEKEIMQDCIRKVASSEYLIFSAMDGVIGKGVYDEIKTAISHHIPVYYLFHQDFLPYENVGIRKIKNAVDDRVYAYVYTFS